MASSSLVSSAEKEKEQAYLYASNANVSNFVSVRLSGDGNYHLWKTQMLCLLEAHDMRGLVDHSPTPIDSLSKMEKKYDSLLRGWIFGSLSEDVLRIVVDRHSAERVWKELESYFGSCKWSEQEETGIKEEQINSDAKHEDATQTKRDGNDDHRGEIIAFSTTKDENTNKTSNIDTNDPTKSTDEEAPQTGKNVSTTKDENTNKTCDSDTDAGESTGKKGASLTMADAKVLLEAFYEGGLTELRYLLREGIGKTKDKINSDGNTILHIAVGIGRNDLVRTILSYYDDGDYLTQIRNLKGSTLLHIAAIVGNTKAAELLVEKNKELLHIKDVQGKTPLIKAYENMRLDTAFSLLNASSSKDDENSENADEQISKSSISDEDFRTGIRVLVQAILAKKYDIAEKIINQNADYAVSNDEVLLALARTFPSGIDNVGTFFCPCFEDLREKILGLTKVSFIELRSAFSILKEDIIWRHFCCPITCIDFLVGISSLLIAVPIVTIIWMIHLIRLALLMAYFQPHMLYYLSWKVATMIVPAIKNIELKKKEYDDAKKVLELVFQKIKGKEHADNSSSSRELTDLYTRPILEAACQDAYDVVDEILEKWPEAILCKDKKGCNIIQLATMHRSVKIYNLIYTFREHSNEDYGTMEDSSENNMLHLAGRLAPSNRLKRHTGAALQLQSELQWHQEVKNLVFPTFVTKENIFGETPEMVFTREHANLVKEGEKWIKAVAESCSITAALIITIVFAAAITVPGGSSQNGVPVFTNEIAFLVFALSDAMSLFSSVTALLVFLSILTSRFAEKDFLIRLPRRLIIGLCALLVSTSAMIVAFSATLFLVFCHQKLWMIAPICGLAFLPIAIFFILQFPLILDLFRSTYRSRFGKNNHHSSKFNADDLKFFFVDKKDDNHNKPENETSKKSNKGGGMSTARSVSKAKGSPYSDEPTSIIIR